MTVLLFDIENRSDESAVRVVARPATVPRATSSAP